MATCTVQFKISRFQPPTIDPPRWDDFSIMVTDTMSILDGLEQIRTGLDASLAFRHSCHHSSCGTCAIRINGEARLACTTRIRSIGTDPIVLKPLDHLPRIADLVVDMAPFFEPIESAWPYAHAEGADSPTTTPVMRLAQCIECGCCVSACAAMDETDVFIGPAAIAAAQRQMAIAPVQVDDLRLAVAGPDGVPACRRHFACNRVCPTRVDPGTAITRLRQSFDQ